MYIRGVKGLQKKRADIVSRTGGNLDYLGEWHSHPPGVETRPSPDDRKVFDWIGDHLIGEGQPPVMIICGDGGKARVFVERLKGALPEPLSAD